MLTTLQYARIQLLRVFRDPVTLIVLFSIPVVILLLFGMFTSNSNDNVSLKIAVVNQSEKPFAKTFATELEKIKAFKKPDEKLTFDQAKERMKEDELDGIVVLPESFGAAKDNAPSGKAQVYVDQADYTTGDIVMGIMSAVADATNNSITGAEPPIQVERQSISGNSTRIFDYFYAIFTAMAIMMAGIFGVASTIPADKKSGVLRRMRVTPFKTSQLVGGLSLAYVVITGVSVALMTLLAIFGFKMTMHGSWIDFGIFVLLACLVMIALGIMVGGWAKNTTQSDIYGQIIFMTSLAFGGVWVPRALMPEWLQGITSYLPLTPIVEGIQRITTDGASIMTLGFQIAVLVGWLAVATIVSIKTFRWE